MKQMDDIDKQDIVQGNWQVPETYFQNMEDRVLNTYRKRQKVRRFRRISMVSCISVIVISAMFFVKSYNVDAVSFFEQVSSLKDSLNLDVKQEINGFDDVQMAFNENISQSDVEKTISDNHNTIKENIVKKNEFTKAELDYLEDYLNEDNYELIYNTIME